MPVYSDSHVKIPQGGLEVLNTSEPIVIDEISWGTNEDTTLAPRLWDFTQENKYGFNNRFVYVREDGWRSTIRPDIVGIYGLNDWILHKFWTHANQYSFSLRKPIEMPAGAVIRIEGYAGYAGDQTIGWHIVTRPL